MKSDIKLVLPEGRYYLCRNDGSPVIEIQDADGKTYKSDGIGIIVVEGKRSIVDVYSEDRKKIDTKENVNKAI